MCVCVCVVAFLCWELCARLTVCGVELAHSQPECCKDEAVVLRIWPGRWEPLPGILESCRNFLYHLEVCCWIGVSLRDHKLGGSPLSASFVASHTAVSSGGSGFLLTTGVVLCSAILCPAHPFSADALQIFWAVMSLNFLVLLPPHPESRDYRFLPPHFIQFI